MGDGNESGKGWFGRARLPVATAYVRLADRNRLLLLAAALGLAGAVVVSADFWLRDARLVSSGPLSAGHATLDSNCASCHVPFESVTADRCSNCHERSTDFVGTYSYPAHYVYTSADQTRAFHREGEATCATCHVEHGGRTAVLTRVDDEQCVSCHAYAPFNANHPQFAFATTAAPDNDALKFGHIKHIERVFDRTQTSDIEGACQTCHRPTDDGLGFRPIRYDESCTTCHLGPDISTDDLPIVPAAGLVARGQSVDLRLGVESLDTIRARNGPGEQWALSTNPRQFEAGGGIVTKFGVSHMDPWITHNLRLLRRVLYPSQGLADLLVATPDVDERQRRALYAEALDTLKLYAAGLAGQPEDWVQADLAEISRTIVEIERRLADPATPLSAVRFRLDSTIDATLSPDQVAEINDFAEAVAKPCVMCHSLENATIVRPAPDQRLLRRAVFNHRAHVIQRGCLECHTEIPFAEYLDTGQRVDDAVDRAAIQNLPKIEVCQTCHTPSKASTACRTCHVFHPASDTRAGLMHSALLSAR